MEKEIWRSIGGDYYNYHVSNFGRLKNSKTGKILKCSPDNVKYPSAYLSGGKTGIRKTFRIHRLVAEHFVFKDKEEFNVVNHIDGDKSNNHYTNLEWTTLQGNIQHAFDTGISKGREYNQMIYNHLEEVDTLLGEGKSYRFIADKFNASYKTVKKIKEDYNFHKPKVVPFNKIYIPNEVLEDALNKFKSGVLIKDVAYSINIKPLTLVSHWKREIGKDKYDEAKIIHKNNRKTLV